MRAKLHRTPAPLHAHLIAVNEALMLGAVRQHELTAAAESANVKLQLEIGERQRAERSLRSAQAQLLDRAGQLKGLVARRTKELTATNLRLEASVVSIQQGKEEYRQLFVQAEIMQRKLRQVTRQILTAQEEERKRISRELHDDVAQTLVGINLELAVLSRSSEADVEQLRKKIAQIQQTVEHSMHAVHRFARGLRPEVLDELGLIPALRAYCEALAVGGKFKIKITAFAGVKALGDSERTVLYRVAQEALTNVARHAHATQVRLIISRAPGAIRMKVIDNGRSFPVEKIFHAADNKRLGLVGMQERLEMVGGSLAIESTPGSGTTVRAVIPFTPEKTKKSSRSHFAPAVSLP